MDKLTQPPADETTTLRDAYAALNRGDIPEFVRTFDPQIEWAEFVDSPGGGTYRGLAAVQAHAMKARAEWAEGTCEPQRFVVAGDKVIVFVHVHVRLKTETEWREGDLGDVYTFRDGRVVHVRIFADRQKALEWAGAQAEP